LAFMRGFPGALLLLGGGLSFAVVFNTVTVNSLERQSEGAALRMLGVGRVVLAGLLLFENLVSTGVGVLVGVPVGRWAAERLILAAQSEEQMDMFAMVASIRPETPWLCAGLVVATTLVSVVPAGLRLAKLDLAGSSKDVAR
jgi:putative ABC transport system permease protein